MPLDRLCDLKALSHFLFFLSCSCAWIKYDPSAPLLPDQAHTSAAMSFLP